MGQTQTLAVIPVSERPAIVPLPPILKKCDFSLPYCCYASMTDNFTSHSHGESESMVPIRRSSIYHSRIMHGASHDPSPGIPILRTGPPEVRSVHDLGVYGLLLSHCLPMVPLGLFAGVQQQQHERLHWRLEALWFDEYSG